LELGKITERKEKAYRGNPDIFLWKSEYLPLITVTG
jgi:hypothetical protein